MTGQRRADLLAPLEDFTRLHTTTLRRFGARAVDLSFPNPRFLSDPRPYRALAEIAARSGPVDLRYSPFGGFTTVRRRVAETLSRQHQLTYPWDHIIMAPGASAALTVALGALFARPDRIILPTPCWMDYPLYLAHAGLGCDQIPAAADKHLDLAALEAAWTPQTAGVILSQPASPTGVVYSHDELVQLADLLQRLGARHGQTPILLADEAHHGQVWANIDCAAPAGHYPRTVTIRSVSKSWEMQGQRTGYLAVSPRLTPPIDAAHRLEQQMRASGHCAPTSLMQHLTAALSDSLPDLTRLATLQHHARQALTAADIDVLDADATRFLYARCPTLDDRGFVRHLADRGVLTMPSSIFHEPGWFRLALNVPESTLSRATDTIGEETHRV